MTEEYARSLCFPNRGVDFSGVKGIISEDMKYEVGDVVYLRPLKEILKNPRIYECVYKNGLIVASIDYGGSFRVHLGDYNEPRVIKEITSEEIEGKLVAYYNLDKGWAEEWMLSNKATASNKLILLKMARYVL